MAGPQDGKPQGNIIWHLSGRPARFKLNDVGRSPDWRVAGTGGLPMGKPTVACRWFLAAYSCGGSSGSRQNRGGFPFNSLRKPTAKACNRLAPPMQWPERAAMPRTGRKVDAKRPV